MPHPLVSVLIPVYNAGEYLRPAVASVLNQTYSNLEILVLDDGSTDGCFRHITDVDDSRVRILRKERSGKAASLNFALKQITGEFYVIQDADDLSHPRRVERLEQALEADVGLAAVFSGYDIILNGKRLAPRSRFKSVEECKANIQEFRMPSVDATAMFRVALTRKFEFEPALQVGQGWDYILRVGEEFPMQVLGECLYSYRIHAQSNTRRDPERRRAVIQQVLQRAHHRRGLCEDSLDACWKERAADNGREHGLVTHFMESVLDLRMAKQPLRAIQTAVACLRLQPFAPSHYKPLVYFAAPHSLIHRYRSMKKRLQ